MTREELEETLKHIEDDIHDFGDEPDDKSLDFEFGNLETNVGDLRVLRAALICVLEMAQN